MALVSAPGMLFGDVILDWSSPGNNPVGYYYVSPYTATVKGLGQQIVLYCIDFNHEVAPPNEWNAVIASLNSADSASFQYGAQWTKYEEAAWLIDQLSAADGTTATGLHQRAIDQYAAWEIFLDAAHTGAYNSSVQAAGGTPFANEISAAYSAALAAVGNGYTPTGWDVLTPDPRGLSTSTQEFLTPSTGPRFPTSEVPEPSTIFLLGTTIAALVMHRRKTVSH